MNEKTNLWKNVINEIDDKHIDSAAETLRKALENRTDSDELIVVKDSETASNTSRVKLSILPIAAAFALIIGIAAIAPVIISENGLLANPSSSNQSGYISNSDDQNHLDFGYNEKSDGTLKIIGYRGKGETVIIPEKI
ncbi:MAG: hypothetical protein IKT78_05945, partial [Ruminiclostridium sp.]|nr:hypothetical protein [Ruminiclostridium sp.]